MKLTDLRPAKGRKPRAKRSAGAKARGSGKPPARGTRGSRRAAAAGRSPVTKAGRCLSRGGSRSVVRHVFREEMSIVNVKELKPVRAGSVVDTEALRREGLVKGSCPGGVKLLGNGEITRKTQRQGRPGKQGGRPEGRRRRRDRGGLIRCSKASRT